MLGFRKPADVAEMLREKTATGSDPRRNPTAIVPESNFVSNHITVVRRIGTRIQQQQQQQQKKEAAKVALTPISSAVLTHTTRGENVNPS